MLQSTDSSSVTTPSTSGAARRTGSRRAVSPAPADAVPRPASARPEEGAGRPEGAAGCWRSPAQGRFRRLGQPAGGVKGTDTLVFVVDMIKDFTANASATGTGAVQRRQGPAHRDGRRRGPRPSDACRQAAGGAGDQDPRPGERAGGHRGPAGGRAVRRGHLETGTVFDASWNHHQPSGFTIGSNPSQVIPAGTRVSSARRSAAGSCSSSRPPTVYGKTGTRRRASRGPTRWSSWWTSSAPSTGNAPALVWYMALCSGAVSSRTRTARRWPARPGRREAVPEGGPDRNAPGWPGCPEPATTGRQHRRRAHSRSCRRPRWRADDPGTRPASTTSCWSLRRPRDRQVESRRHAGGPSWAGSRISPVSSRTSRTAASSSDSP